MVFIPFRKLDPGETTQAIIPDEDDELANGELEEYVPYGTGNMVVVSTNPHELIEALKAAGDFIPHIKVDPHIGSARLDDCGRLAEFANGEGRIGYTRWQCGCYRTCEFCLEYRANHKQGLVIIGMQREVPEGTEPQIIYYHFNADAQAAVKHFSQAVGAKHYLRLPQDDGSIVMFVHPQATITPDPTTVLEQRVLSAREMCQLDWHALCNTPYRQRITGRLGITAPKEPEDSMLDVVVDTKLLISQASKEERLTAYAEAVAATSNDADMPKFVEDIVEQTAYLSKAMTARTDAYLFALNQRGIAVNVVYQKVHIKINRNYQKRTWLRFISGQEVERKDLVGYLYGWEKLLAQQEIAKTT